MVSVGSRLGIAAHAYWVTHKDRSAEGFPVLMVVASLVTSAPTLLGLSVVGLTLTRPNGTPATG